MIEDKIEICGGREMIKVDDLLDSMSSECDKDWFLDVYEVNEDDNGMIDFGLIKRRAKLFHFMIEVQKLWDKHGINSGSLKFSDFVEIFGETYIKGSVLMQDSFNLRFHGWVLLSHVNRAECGISTNSESYYSLLAVMVLIEIDKGFYNRKTKTEGVKTYLMFDNNSGYFKIGRSKDVSYREKVLSYQFPDVKTIAVSSKIIEKELHKSYKEHRLRGEWFDIPKNKRRELLSCFDDILINLKTIL